MSAKAPSIRFNQFTEEWKTVEFSEVFEEVSERTSDTDNYPLYSLTLEKGVTPKSERYERSFLLKKDEDNYKIVKNDEFVYNPMNLTLGAVAKYKGGQSVAVSGYYNVFRTKEGYNSGFFENLLKTGKMLLQYKSIATGSLIEKQRVHFSQFVKIKRPIPVYLEQKKISDFFSLLDRKIERQQEKIKQLELYKKGMLQKIFTREIRFKDENERDFPEWEQKTLGELGQFRKGGTLSKADLSETGEACILYGELYTRYTSIIDEVYSKTNSLDNKVHGRINDVLIPSSGESAIDIAQVSALSVDKVLLGGDLNVFTPNKSVSGPFLSYQINSIKRKELAKLAQGASIVHLYSESLRSLKVWIPDYNEQLKIVSFLYLLDKKILHEKRKLQTLNEIKKSYMQKMFV